MMRRLGLLLLMFLVDYGVHGKTVSMDIEDDESINTRSVDEPLEMINPSHVAEGELYEGDMLLSEEQWAALKTRKAVAYLVYRWTEGADGYPLVPYVFLDSIDQNLVRGALDHWMEHTCINFEETNNTNQSHLQFHIGDGCWSYVGMLNSNGQTVTIGQGCDFGTVVHEVGHAIGFNHEHTRSDRDAHITILEENIIPEYRQYFLKKPNSTINNYNVPYDLASRMHYGQFAFNSNNKPAIITKDPLHQELIGHHYGLTHRDILLANRMYNCTGKWLTKCSISSDPCLNDGFTGKDCQCVCPGGTKGSHCEEIVDDYYAHLRNPLSEKITSEKKITVDSTIESGMRFTKWIVPPSCKRAKLTFTTANLRNCNYENLYVKTNFSDKFGQMLCGSDVEIGTNLTSDTVIIITMLTYYRAYSPPTTIWEADATFEDIPGCYSTTDPPTTDPPTTDPPTTDPPTTEPPTTDPPATDPPTTDPPTTDPPTTDPPTTQPPVDCIDNHQSCSYWAGKGYCEEKYVPYMNKYCKKSCNLCDGVTSDTCSDYKASSQCYRYYYNGIKKYCLSGERWSQSNCKCIKSSSCQHSCSEHKASSKCYRYYFYGNLKYCLSGERWSQSNCKCISSSACLHSCSAHKASSECYRYYFYDERMYCLSGERWSQSNCKCISSSSCEHSCSEHKASSECYRYYFYDNVKYCPNGTRWSQSNCKCISSSSCYQPRLGGRDAQ